MNLGELELEQAAKEAAGNWHEFDSFIWFRKQELQDSENWAVIYTCHRDSGLLDQSNSMVINRELARFAEGKNPDVVFESHNHWAVGHVDGFSIRVFRRGKITKAFRRYHDLAQRIEEYPFLDETDYSNREYEATVENINCAAWRLKSGCDLPVDWAEEVYYWLSQHRDDEIENTGDDGGYPSEEALEEAFVALGYRASEDLALN